MPECAAAHPPSSPWPPAGWDELLLLFPPHIRRIINGMPTKQQRALREIRLRSGRPLVAVFTGGDRYLGPDGRPRPCPHQAYQVGADEARAFLLAITRASVYAHERELREGFLTLPGGHRVGFTGQALLEGGQLRTLRAVSGFNVRIAREVPGAAAPLMPHLFLPSGLPAHTLLISPPGCGKTTLLRDVTRLLSTGSPPAGPGWRVTLIDERSEVAACRDGVPQLDVGPHTDVLDGVPKGVGIPMAVRSLGPQVLVTDEIGGPDDLAALAEAQRSGVAVIATCHGSHAEDVVARMGTSYGLRWDRAFLLGDRPHPGTVEKVLVISAGTSQ